MPDRYRITVNLTREEYDLINKEAQKMGEDKGTLLKMIIMNYLNKKI